MAELVDDEVFVERRALQENEVARGVALEAAKARYAKQPGHNEDANAADVNRLGVALQPVEPLLRPLELPGSRSVHLQSRPLYGIDGRTGSGPGVASSASTWAARR